MIKKNMRFRRKLPVILQINETECGAACLAMILSYFGRPTTVSECREICGQGRDGVTAYDISEAASFFGLKAETYTVSLKELSHLPLPAIIHWKFNHFVILEKWSDRKIVILDPGIGRLDVTREEFNAGFTGVASIFEPEVHFKKPSKRDTFSWRDYLRNIMSIPGAKKVFAQVLGASLLLQLFGLITPLFTKVLIDHVLVVRAMNLLMMLGLGGFIIVMSYGLISYLRAALLIFLQGRTDVRMMVGFVEHMLSLPYGFFQSRRSGDLLMRLTSNESVRELLTSQTLALIMDGFFVISYLVIIFTQAPIFGFAVSGLGILQVLLLVATAKKFYQYLERDLACRAEADSYLLEILKGIAIVKASGSEKHLLKGWTNRFYRHLNVSLDRFRFYALIETATNITALLNPLILLWLGGWMVINGTLSLGSMLAFEALGIAFLTPLSSLLHAGQQIQMAGAYLERISDVVLAESEKSASDANKKVKLQGKIELRKLNFRYNPNSAYVLKEVSLTVNPGQKLAIIGRTGAGKTTLAMILLGLYKPSAGEILYDEVSIDKLDIHELRRQFGAVLQHSFLFHGSIRQNIALYHPEFPFENLIEAARKAAIHEEIMEMPMGYETIIAEDGGGLSGGQIQRIALARAILHRPSLLLLDEATSHLDAVTEAMIDKNLSSWVNTRIIIAHRLSTIKDADLIVVLDLGRIVEWGRHEELLAADGLYAQLVKQQIGR